MFKTYQEIEARYIVPAVRSYLASALKKKGLPQHKIATLLKITEGAISQYFMKKRAQEVIFDGTIKVRIDLAADAILKGANPIKEMQDVIHYIEERNMVCGICRGHNHEVEAGCRVCFS